MRFFLDLNDRVCTTLENNGYIVYYKEYDYSNSMLDYLYGQISAFEIDELIVIARGTVHRGMSVNGMRSSKFRSVDGSELTCSHNLSDLEKINHLAKACGVKSVRFVEHFGYYTTFKEEACYVEQTNGMFKLFIAKKDEPFCFDISTLEGVSENILGICKRTGIKKCVNTATLYNMQLLFDTFRNIHCVSDVHILAELSMFAYTVSEYANKFVFSVDSTQAISQASESIPVLEPEVPELIEEAIPVDDLTKRKEKAQKKTQKTREMSTVDKLCVAMSIIFLVLTGVSFGLNRFSGNSIIKAADNLEALNTQISSLEKEQMLYEDFLNVGTFNAVLKNLDDLGVYGSKYAENILTIGVDSDKAEIVATFNSKKKLNSFLKKLQKEYPDASAVKYGEDSSQDIEYLNEEPVSTEQESARIPGDEVVDSFVEEDLSTDVPQEPAEVETPSEEQESKIYTISFSL